MIMTKLVKKTCKSTLGSVLKSPESLFCQMKYNDWRGKLEINTASCNVQKNKVKSKENSLILLNPVKTHVHLLSIISVFSFE